MKKADHSAVAVWATFTLITLLHTWSHALEITLNCTAGEYINTSQCSQPTAAPSQITQCLSCHTECTECYGPGSDQCYVCRGSSQEVMMMGGSGSASGDGLMCDGDGLVRDMTRDVVTCEPTGSPLSTGAIIGIAVGGVAVIVFVLILCVCVCCLCWRTKKRRGKQSFKPMTEVKEDHIGNLDDKNNLTVDKVNLEGASNGTKSREQHVLQQISPIVTQKAGGATHDQRETALQRAITPPPIMSESFKDKGYVPMSSAGSIRPSKSMGDIQDNTDGQDIYVEPLEPSAAGAFLSTAQPHSHKPPVLPKPAGLTPTHKNTTAAAGSSSSRSHSPAAHKPLDKQKSMEEYVTPEVFLEDREAQELIDSYYNSETIESIRLNRDPALDPSQSSSLYVNLEQPGSSHSLKTGGAHQLESPDDGKEKIESFLPAARAAKHDTSADEPNKGDYYNVSEFQASSLQQERENDYNYVEHNRSHDMESSEDGQYVYMKSGHHSGLDEIIIGTPPSPAMRHQSEPGKKVHKYINLPYDESGQLAIPMNGHSTTSKENRKANTSRRRDDEVSFLKTSPKPKPRQKPVNVSQSSVGDPVNSTPQDVEGEEEQPLYVNLKPDEEDKGGEELYENIR